MPFLRKLGAIHAPHYKNTAEMPAVRMPAPAVLRIPMSQHIGAPATPIVTVGDTVKVGQKIGEGSGYVSSPIFSPVSGKVKKIDQMLQVGGRTCPTVIIESDGLGTVCEEIAPPALTDFDSFSGAIRESGLVGLGGAGFPTQVKFDAERKGLIKTVVINAAECEPYITSDTRTMLDDGDALSEGVALLERFVSAEEIIFGIENNKPECIAAMKERFAKDPKVKIASLPSTYPQGGEKILIHNTTGRVVPEGKLPADVGVLVVNVTSLAFLAHYVKTGMPLIEKCVTVDGSAVKSPKNVIVPIGTSIQDLIDFAGGFSEEPGKVLYGGPMMGSPVYDMESPILKTTNAITVLNKKDAASPKVLPCIHCGRCVAHCPMGLNPTLFIKAMNLTDAGEKATRLENGKIQLCIECGCCSYECPSKRPLVQTNRLAKADLREYKAHQATLKK